VLGTEAIAHKADIPARTPHCRIDPFRRALLDDSGLPDINRIYSHCSPANSSSPRKGLYFLFDAVAAHLSAANPDNSPNWLI
jgi:hypothetical protein